MLGKGLKVKMNVSRDMVEDGFIPVSVVPEVVKKVDNYYKKMRVTDMEGNGIQIDPVMSRGGLLGFYFDIDIPNFSNISLMIHLGENNGRRV